MPSRKRTAVAALLRVLEPLPVANGLFQTAQFMMGVLAIAIGGAAGEWLGNRFNASIPTGWRFAVGVTVVFGLLSFWALYRSQRELDAVNADRSKPILVPYPGARFERHLQPDAAERIDPNERISFASVVFRNRPVTFVPQSRATQVTARIEYHRPDGTFLHERAFDGWFVEADTTRPEGSPLRGANPERAVDFDVNGRPYLLDLMWQGDPTRGAFTPAWGANASVFLGRGPFKVKVTLEGEGMDRSEREWWFEVAARGDDTRLFSAPVQVAGPE